MHLLKCVAIFSIPLIMMKKSHQRRRFFRSLALVIINVNGAGNFHFLCSYILMLQRWPRHMTTAAFHTFFKRQHLIR
jgi:hypothetical protein